MKRDDDRGAAVLPASRLERLVSLTIEGQDQDRPSPVVDTLMVLGLVVAALVSVSLTHTTGPAATSMFVGDEFILFDGAWRVYNGQASSNDYYNPLGFLYFFVFGSAMKVLGPQVATVVYTTAAVNLTLLAWAWSVFRRRLSSLMAVVLTITIGAHLFGNLVYGHQFYIIGMGAYYNKVGFTLLSILLALAVLNKRGSPPTPWTTLLGIGLALGLVFAVKISFFIIAVPAVVLGLYIAGGPSIKRLIRNLAVVALAGLATLGVLSFATGTSLTAYLADLATASNARSFLTPVTVVSILTQWYFLLCLVIVGAVAVLLLPRNDRAKLVHILLLAALGLGTIAWLGITNSQPVDFQYLCSLLAVLCALGRGREPLIRSASKLPNDHGAVLGLCYLALLFFPFAVVIVTSALSGIYARSLTLEGIHDSDRALTIATPAMAGWQGVGLVDSESDYIRSVQEGVRVLEEVAKPPDTVQVLDFANPFSFALGLPPAEGGALWWHATYNISPEQLVGAARSLTRACIVMYPLSPAIPIIRDLLYAAIEQDLENDFTVIRDEGYWRVYFNRGCR